MADGGPYDIGDEVTLEGVFRVNKVLTDPTAVTCRVRKPDGSFVNPDPTVTRVSVGVYHAIVLPDVAGDWQYRFVGTGTAKAAERKMFMVRPDWQT